MRRNKDSLSQKLPGANGGDTQRAVDSIDQLMHEFEEQFPGVMRSEDEVRFVVEKDAFTSCAGFDRALRERGVLFKRSVSARHPKKGTTLAVAG